MRTETTTRLLYKFDELPEDTKQKALENLYDINVDHEWWDYTYDDAKTIGLKITGFDIGRSNDIDGKLIFPALDVVKNILKEHGESCDTYKLAMKYKNVLQQHHDNEDEYQIEETSSEFEQALKEEYLSMLRKEYEYLTSEEAVKETIAANDYEFDVKGKLA